MTLKTVFCGLSLAALLAAPAFGQDMNPCSADWPPQAATREQIRAALGVDPCGTDGTRPLRTYEERLAAKKLEAEEIELDARIHAAEAGIYPRTWRTDISIWNIQK